MTVLSQGTGTATFLGVDGGAAAAVSLAAQARIRYNTGLQQLELSQNTGPYYPISVGGAEITVANIAALTAWPDLPLTDGSIAAMHSLMAIWQLRKTAVDAPDGITIIPTNSGTGRWFRMHIPNKFWHAQLSWHINAGTGNDENQGDTALVPLATWAEFVRRMGPGRIDNYLATITVYIDSNLTEDITMSDLTADALGAYLVVQGQRTVLYSGSVTAKTNWQASPVPTRGTFTDAALPVSWTASGLVGKMVVMTSGAATGYIGWVELDQGAKTAVVSRLFDPITYSTADPGVGDTFDVVDLTTITGNSVSFQSGCPYIQFSDIHFVCDFYEFDYCRAVVFVSCCLSGTLGYGFYVVRSEVQTAGCRIAATAGIVRCFQATKMFVDACALEVPVTTRDDGGAVVGTETISQCTGAVSISSYGNIEISGGSWWGHFDNVAAQYGIRFEGRAGSGWLNGLFWGLNNLSNYAVVVGSAAQGQYGTTPTYGPNVINDVLVGNVAGAYAALPIADVNLLAALVPYT